MSNHPVVIVLVYNHMNHSVEWCMYSEATRLTQALPHWEIIGENHPRYAELLQLAPTKPEVIAQET